MKKAVAPRRRALSGPEIARAEDELFPARKRGLGPGWFFLGLGLMATVTLGAWAVLPTLRQQFDRPANEATPDYASLLPAGAPLPPSSATAQLPDVPLPAYVVGYPDAQGVPTVALGTWDRFSNAYAWTSRAALNVGDPHLGSISAMTVQDIGTGGTVIVASGPVGEATTVGVRVLLTRDVDGLRRMSRVGTDGAAAPASFPFDGLAESESGPSLTFSDMDADGLAEVRYRTSRRDEADAAQKVFEVYRFVRGDLVYDETLSDAARIREGLFPEP
jgi:hypothetical protein